MEKKIKGYFPNSKIEIVSYKEANYKVRENICNRKDMYK